MAFTYCYSLDLKNERAYFCVVLILEVYSIINKMVCLRTHYMAPFLRQVYMKCLLYDNLR